MTYDQARDPPADAQPPSSEDVLATQGPPKRSRQSSVLNAKRQHGTCQVAVQRGLEATAAPAAHDIGAENSGKLSIAR